MTASELAADLDLDHGYLSRILRRFGEGGLLARKRAPDDGRQSLIAITAKGRKAFAPLNKGSHDQVAAMLESLSRPSRRASSARWRPWNHARRGPRASRRSAAAPASARRHGLGTSAHGALYAQEYGWDITFEALVAKIMAEFIENFDPARERCWIAELDGERVGSVFVVRKTDEVAKLRLLIVDPQARADSGSASGWSTNACGSPRPPAIRR